MRTRGLPLGMPRGTLCMRSLLCLRSIVTRRKWLRLKRAGVSELHSMLAIETHTERAAASASPGRSTSAQIAQIRVAADGRERTRGILLAAPDLRTAFTQTGEAS